MKPGEIYLVDLGLKAKVRPAIVVSREDADPPRMLTVFVPVTTENRGSRYEIALGSGRPFRVDSFANVQGLASIEDVNIQRRLGQVSPDTLKAIRAALRWALELEHPPA